MDSDVCVFSLFAEIPEILSMVRPSQGETP